MAINTEKYTQNPFIKGEDLEDGERLILTIKAAYETTFPSGDTVPVLEFLETDQKLTLNKTRVRKAVELFGPDSDAWIDRKVALYAVPVQYNGKSQMGVALAGVAAKKKIETSSVAGRAAVNRDVQFMGPPPSERTMDEADESPF